MVWVHFQLEIFFCPFCKYLLISESVKQKNLRIFIIYPVTDIIQHKFWRKKSWGKHNSNKTLFWSVVTLKMVYLLILLSIFFLFKKLQWCLFCVYTVGWITYYLARRKVLRSYTLRSRNYLCCRIIVFCAAVKSSYCINLFTYCSTQC